MQGQYIHVSFGEHGAFGDINGAPGLKQTVQMLPFFIDGGVAAVNVFCIVLLGQSGQDPAAKGYDLS